ncbi:hypothetical protein KEC56_07885 [Microbacterium sp. YMB-B2]|uniref:Uncharacterized protein n=1 Tax=Microbacterium tenebrionis TaxID=2830665 RepID=A0A9X1LP34_9MICO|nr:hypothetical protein [Microbacterium tenebrionis]MCC2029437.1 hypothetical protein [Microbacterium tenebrionis]
MPAAVVWGPPSGPRPAGQGDGAIGELHHHFGGGVRGVAQAVRPAQARAPEQVRARHSRRPRRPALSVDASGYQDHERGRLILTPKHTFPDVVLRETSKWVEPKIAVRMERIEHDHLVEIVTEAWRSQAPGAVRRAWEDAAGNGPDDSQ